MELSESLVFSELSLSEDTDAEFLKFHLEKRIAHSYSYAKVHNNGYQRLRL